MISEKLIKAYKTFGENVVWLRENMGLTKKEMSDILGICQKTLKKIEKGHIPSKVLLKVILRIEDKFKLNAEFMFKNSYKDLPN